jgi:CheY-like chemotaxis protein
MTQTVLIVDDQRDIIRMLKTGLESLGHGLEVKGALSGEEALLETRLNQVDLLITDVRLPGMSGLELMAAIRHSNPTLSVVLLTGTTDLKVRQSAAKAGADAFFLKPVPLSTFLETVENILGLGRQVELTQGQNNTALDEHPTVSRRLAELHHQLGSIAVILINDNGEQVVRSGDLPEGGSETAWIPAVMAAFSAGQKIGHFLGNHTPNNLQIFHGSKFDLVLTTVGSAYAMLVATSEPMVGERTGRVSAQIQDALVDITDTLEQMGVPVWEEDHTPAPLSVSDLAEMTPAEETEIDQDLDALFEGQGFEFFEDQDPDDFWKPPDESTTSGSLSADALSYEQARQLGLAPGEED